jgi:cell division protein FtsW (lipid II flippase)
MKNNFFKDDFGFWRKLINAWSILFFIMILIDLFHYNLYENILNVISSIYISILAIYVSNKEFERWYDKHKGNHPGEFFVVIWSVIIASLLICDFIFRDLYNIPGSLVSSYIAVLTILVITKKSKELYKFKRKQNKTR